MNKNKMKVGTDFSGIGAPEMALINLGVDFEQVFTCEIDKYARQSYLAMHQAPGKFYNDITQRDHKEVEQLDLYCAGFPCQAFSIAGQRKGFDDVRGTLFFNVAEFIQINQPKMFILENVKGLLSHDNGRTYQTITDILTNGGGTLNGQMSLDVFEDGLGYHCAAQVLNTKDFGIPQNRERIFIVGFKDFREFSFPKAEPLELRLKDMLQDNPNAKYYLSDKMIDYFYGNSQKNKDKGNEFRFNPTDGECISTSITTKEGGGIESNFLNLEWIADYRADEGLRIRKDNCAPCLLASMKDDWQNTYSMGNPPILKYSTKIRRLTPLECWRLQAFPDDAFFKAQAVCSDTQLYKQAGNSISVNVLERILNKMI